MEENSPQPPQNQETKPSEPLFPKIPVIRTYEHDIEEAIGQKKISSAAISIAEADLRRKQPETAPKNPTPRTEPPTPPVPPRPVPPAPLPPTPEHHVSTPPAAPSSTPTPAPIRARVSAPAPVSDSDSNRGHSGVSGIFKIILSLIFIGAGIYAGYYFYTISPLSKTISSSVPVPVTENTALIPSIVTPDSQKTLNITGQNPQEIISEIQQTESVGVTNTGNIATSSPSNTSGTKALVELILEETQNGLTTQVTAPQFIANIGVNPPDAFTSSLNDAWMLGIDNSAPFVIFTTNFFQNTFAGILAWEPTLPHDLGSLFKFDPGISGTYQNRILDNKNIREFVSPSGTPIFLYGFIDNATLLITRDERTFSDIVGRIEKQTYVR